MRNNLTKSFYIIVLLLSQVLSAQQNYILHFKYNVNTYSAVSPGCSVYFGTENNRTANYIFGYEVIYNLDDWLDYMIIVDGNTTYGIYVKDCDGNINKVQGLFIPKDNLNHTITQDYYYTSTYKSQSYSIGFTDSILFYQPIQLDQIGTSDPTECIADSCQSISFKLTIKNPSAISGVCIKAKDVNGNLIGLKFISGNNTTGNVRFCDLNLYSPTYFGQLIQFEAEGNYCANYYCKTLGGNIMYKSFFQQLPVPITIKLFRTSCGGDTLRIFADPIYIRYIETLKFRAKPSDSAESTSNIVALKVLRTAGNYIYLTENLQAGLVGFSDDEGYYDLQVFNNSYSDSVKSEDITCGVIKSFHIDSVPKKLKLSGYQSSYKFTDSSSSTTYTYNISKHGTNDAVAYLTVGDETKIKKWQYSMDGGYRWWDVSTGMFHTGYNTYSYTPMCPGGWYSFRIIDIADCLSQMKGFNQPITEPDKLVVSSVSVSPVSCNRNDKVDTISKWNDGAVNLSWSGGCGPYSIFLYDSIGSFIKSFGIIYRFNKQINNLSPGRYKAILNAHVLADSLSIIINVPSKDDIKLTVLKKNVDCYGNNNGEIVLSVSNSDSVFTYEMYRNDLLKDSVTQKSNSRNYIELLPANYKIKVINQDLCYDSLPSITITQPDKISLSATPGKIARYGGSTGKIDVAMNGGTLPYRISFKDSLNVEINNHDTAANAISYNNLTAGKYKVVLTDKNLCKDSLSDIKVLQPLSALMFTYRQKNIDCFGNSTGSVSMTAGGGWPPYRFGWNGAIKGSDTTISGLSVSVNIDSVLVVDSMDVRETLPVSILQPDLPLTAGLKSITQPLCFGDENGKIKVKINGGTKPYQISTDSIQWDSGDSVTDIGAVLNYKINLKDSNNCHTSLLVTVGQPTPVVAAQVSVTGASCNKKDGAIINSVTGGTVSGDYDYQWYFIDSSKSIYNLAPELYNVFSGVYKFKVIDDHHCADSLQVLVSDTDGPVINAYSIDSVSCSEARDGGIHITDVTGGTPAYTFYLDNRKFSGDTAEILSGDYQLRVEDIEKCKSYKSVSLTQPEPISIHSVMKNPTCKDYTDGAIALYPSGGNGSYRFRWNIPDTTNILNTLTTGIYDATVLDRKNCFAKKKFELIDPVPPAPFWEQHNAVLCEGNFKTLDAGYFNSYCWYKNSDTLSRGRKIAVYQSGVYYLRITDNKGCAGIDSFKLDVSEHPLDAVLLMADTAAVNEPVTVVDVTWPVPDSIEWLFDSEVQFISSNEWSQDFTFAYEGDVLVTLRAWYGGCYSDSTQTVCFHGPWDDREKSLKQNTPLILNYTIFPNPNTGLFSAQVDLSREADISLTMYNSGMSTTLNNRKNYGAKEYKEEYNIAGYMPGIYLLVLRAGDEQRIMKIVIE